jgi:hypothetical protein
MVRSCGCNLLIPAGSMSGVTLGSLVSSAIGLYGHSVTSDDLQETIPRGSRIRAGYPPREIAINYVDSYIRLVHRWYPFLNLDELGQDISKVYDKATTISDYGNFTLLTIFGISSISKPIPDPFTSEMYFHAAAAFLDSVLSTTSCDTIRAMLLLCIFRLRSWKDEGGHVINAWRTIGLAVRIALELGLTRNNQRWAFEEEENEARRWLWW